MKFNEANISLCFRQSKLGVVFIFFFSCFRGLQLQSTLKKKDLKDVFVNIKLHKNKKYEKKCLSQTFEVIRRANEISLKGIII